MQLMNCVTVNHSIEVDVIYFSSVSQFLAWDYTEIALNIFHLYRKGHGCFPVFVYRYEGSYFSYWVSFRRDLVIFIL